MRVNTIRVPCTNLREAEKFYTKILERDRSFGELVAGYIGFQLGNVTLLLEKEEAGEFEAGRYLGFSLEVADIHAYYSRQKNDAQFSGPPQEQDWGGFMTHITDSNGNVLSIVQTS